jgi:hypothetical protein
MFSVLGTFVEPPGDLERATIYMSKNRIVYSGHSPIRKEQRRHFKSFLDYPSILEPEERSCFDYLTLEDDGSTIAKALQNGDAIVISVGSFQDQFGTAAWALEGVCSMGRITGDVTVPGTEKDQSAYCSELAGIYSLLICVKHICDFFNIHSVSIELIGCDGQSALDKAFNHVSIIRIEDPAHDILFAICPLWAHSPVD